MCSLADVYESHMEPAMFAPLAEHLLEVARPRAGVRLLDLACGVGIVVRLSAPLIQPGGFVVGSINR